jgi:hypothetical protein
LAGNKSKRKKIDRWQHLAVFLKSSHSSQNINMKAQNICIKTNFETLKYLLLFLNVCLGENITISDASSPYYHFLGLLHPSENHN